MLIQKLTACTEFVAGDGTLLRELLHPEKQAIALRYSLAHAIVPGGRSSLPHSLKTSEVYYILSGTGEMHINGENQVVEPGDAVYIPPHAEQFIRNNGTAPLVFICIVDPAWRQADETIHAEPR
ncbi:MAG: cupin domain-containing protein [Tildeniella nuda ZEHNDER 1965/U140]|jgi:mannose-6-phosphate isomerase-like protein (cupin superfamily)|nr:cupin domain-containing protein [Tildeniella nuda ZEHNDER 1965/U140]